MTTTTTPGFDLYNAVRSAVDDFQHDRDLIQLSMLMRLLQLREQALHPDDCCTWSDDGDKPSMGALADLLKSQGHLDLVETGARLLYAELQLARATSEMVEDHADRWSNALDAAESWGEAFEIHSRREDSAKETGQ